MVVGASVSVGKELGGTVATDGACVVGTCDGVPVVGTSEGRGVVGAALEGSRLGVGVVGAHDGGIVDGTPLGGGEGCQEGLGDVGMADGGIEGNKVGSRVGTSEGAGVGGRVSSEGAIDGSEEDGALVGIELGLVEGAKVGTCEGWNDGAGVDARVGLPVGTSVGNPVLRWVGRAVRRNVGTPVCPATSGTSDGAGVGLLDATLTETTEIRFASRGGLDPSPTVDATAGSTPPTAACAELVPGSELDSGSDGDTLGALAPEGRAGAILANEAPLAVGTLSAACAELVACEALQ